MMWNLLAINYRTKNKLALQGHLTALMGGAWEFVLPIKFDEFLSHNFGSHSSSYRHSSQGDLHRDVASRTTVDGGIGLPIFNCIMLRGYRLVTLLFGKWMQFSIVVIRVVRVRYVFSPVSTHTKTYLWGFPKLEVVKCY